MKKYLMLILAALLVLAFFGCPSEAGPQTLKIAAPSWIQKKTDLLAAIERFKEANPDVTIELITVDKFAVSTFIPEWDAGKTPFDLFVSGTGNMLSDAIVKGYMEPMDDMLTGDMSKDRFVGGFLNQGLFKKADGSGSFFPMIPFLGEVAITGVNVEVFKKSGLWKDNKPVGMPGWDEKALTGWFMKLAPNAPGGALVEIWDKEFLQYNYCGPLLAMTGNFLAKDGKGYDISSNAAKAVMGMLQKLYAGKLANYTTTDTAGYEAWKAGNAGIFYAGQGHTMELANVKDDPSLIAYIAWPGADKNGSIIWTHSVWIPKVSENKDLARQFIREEIFSIPFQQWQFNNYGKLPVIKEAFGDGIEKYQEYMPLILDVANASKSLPLYVDAQKYDEILKKYLSEAAFGRMSVDDAFKKIKEESASLDFTDMRAE